ncbi:MAG: hypothetical protein IH991_16980 [Planctomycetes bacterium]|nr:hypothetical protein [Planctomycetota bacterium]
MKTRLWIIVIGVCLGFLGKWVFGNWSGTPTPANGFQDNRDGNPGQSAARSEVAELDSFLIPPAEIPGLPTVARVDSEVTDFSKQFPVVSLLDPDFSSGERATFHPHGNEVCSSGCAVSNHPTEELTHDKFRELIRQFADDDIDENSLAYETLLFYGRQTQALLTTLGPGELDPLRTASLKAELSKSNAKVWIRLLDENGEIRSFCPPTNVPMDRRHVFKMDANNLQPLVTSGTVKRVGLDHLWVRL